MSDVPQLAPDDDEEDRGTGEGEPERRGDPELLGEDPTEGRAGDHPAVVAEAVDACDPTLQRGRDGPLPHRHRRRPPDERVRPEDEEHRQREHGPRGQREREVGERLDDQPDAHDVAEADPTGDPAIGRRAGQTAHRHDRGQQTEADRPHTEALRRVEDEHGPGGAVGDVEDEDGEDEGAHGGVVPHPPEALDDVGPQAPLGSGAGPPAVSREHDPGDEQGAECDEHGLGSERPDRARGEQRRAERRTGEVVHGE